MIYMCWTWSSILFSGLVVTYRNYGLFFFFFSSRRRHTRFDCDWSSDVCSSDLETRVLPRTGMWVKPATVTPLIIGGLIAAPLAMPILPVAYAVKYCRFWNVQAVHVENVPLGDLPQFFADMYGWPEQVHALDRKSVV